MNFTSSREVFHDTEDKMRKTLEAVSREFATVRTGRATPALVDGIKVEYYGTPTPLKSLASITTPDPKLIVIQPWDTSVVGEVEKAILRSELGITPINDGKVIRLQIPDLSKERRLELAKLVKKMAEDGRVSLRTVRHAAVEHVRKLEKDKLITEDERFKGQDEIQKITDKYIVKIDEVLAAKEREITEI
ncbi:MAG: ribosome recycling factor [Omnitrophica WOR_2 bacterium SM23_29]|nr:MAG: ribosome recycling factor [Omnitrophica WOR_2 bacterium SM23_29]